MALTTSSMFNLNEDNRGQNSFGLDFAFDNFSATLVANTAESVTVPSNFEYWEAIFSYTTNGADVWVANNATAAVPAGATFASTTSQLNPIARRVKAGDVLSFITGNPSANVNVSFYAYQNNTGT
jgi:hypothetical protein